MPCVYVLTNPANPGLVKIGHTKKTAAERAAQISSGTGIAAPFEVAWTTDIPTAAAAARLESLVHQALSANPYNRAREFFTITVDRAREIIEEIGHAENIITITPKYWHTSSGRLDAIQEIIDDEVVAEQKGATKCREDFISARLDKTNSVERGLAYLADPSNDIWVGKWFFDNGKEIQKLIQGHKNMSDWLLSFREIQDGQIIARPYIYHKDILIRTNKISQELALQVRKNEYEAQTRLMRGLVSASKKPIIVERSAISAILHLVTRRLWRRFP